MKPYYIHVVKGGLSMFGKITPIFYASWVRDSMDSYSVFCPYCQDFISRPPNYISMCWNCRVQICERHFSRNPDTRFNVTAYNPVVGLCPDCEFECPDMHVSMEQTYGHIPPETYTWTVV